MVLAAINNIACKECKPFYITSLVSATKKIEENKSGNVPHKDNAPRIYKSVVAPIHVNILTVFTRMKYRAIYPTLLKAISQM